MNPERLKKPEIIIVDDHLIFRQGLKAIINFEEVGSVIGEASNGEEFLSLLSELKPDLILMDIDMPQMNGFEATKKALEINPDLKIIAFTVFSEDEYYTKMMMLGAKGFILKSSGFNELEYAIKLVMKGESYFTGKFQNQINPEYDAIENVISNDNEDSVHIKSRKMIFFPWVVNKISSVNK